MGDILIVLRHAVAGVKLPDPARDFTRGLDERGLATAEALPDSIRAHVAPAAIVSSPAQRCLQTVRPLSVRSGLPLGPSETLRASATRSEAIELLLALPDRSVVCTHGEVIEALFGAMACEKGAFLVLRRAGTVLRPMLYVGPPESERPGLPTPDGALST